MEYIPDPIEILEARAERAAEKTFRADGTVLCPDCGQQLKDTNDLIHASPDPYSTPCCYDCLLPDDKKAYDKWVSYNED